MYKRLLLLLLVSMTMGCVSGTAPIVASYSLPPLPALEMIPCPPLPLAQDGTARSLLINHTEVAKAYLECSQKQMALAKHLQALHQAMPKQ